MKKIFTFFIMLSMIFSLTACSSKNKDDVILFFDALDNTLKADSGHINGNVDMKGDSPYTISFDIQFIQVGDIQIAAVMDLEAGGNVQKDFLDFYIKDGKTYLNSSGTKTQSVVENIGLERNKKIAVYNPFLSFSDDELNSFFKSSSKNGNTYTYDIDARRLTTLIDAYGTFNASKAQVTADIDNELLNSVSLHVVGEQNINEQKADIDLTVKFSVEQLNSLDHIDFPDDLDSYIKE